MYLRGCLLYTSSLSYKEDTELTGEEGESSEMTEEEASARRELFEGYAEKINAGEMTMEEAAEDFALSLIHI